ncbi:hypothetical protein GLOIN_2v1480993 [Rhizophagus clarus]|uniref:Integrase catalytic domain-containing protein n=1 Tax=Rhizophagus clarus TaxID=94130 RepID=A0A8H3LVC8_9GLOM|nr:hypothetical protein GLOIN_2v1480993 [Rhizophagus clarus]
MPALLPLIPIIQIDSGEARDLDVSIALQKIYYQPVGYQRNAKKLLEASFKAGALKEKYNDPECPLIWPKIFLTDKGPEFRGDYINNSLTKQIGMAPAVAIEKESIIANPSYPRDGPVGFDEKKLPSDMLVRYLLYSSDQEGGRRRAEDLNCNNPEGCHLHCKAKKRRPCSACGKPTKLVKPTGIVNDLYSYCNKSNYQIRHVNMLWDKAQMFDLYSEEVRLRGET